MILDGDKEKLGDYMRTLADLMGLRDWTFWVSSDKPDNPEHAASIDTRYGRKHAVLYMGAGWEQWQATSVRQTIVHELLHCHMNQARNVINNLQSVLGTPLYTVAYDSLMDYLEVGIDAISTEWAETLPLPVLAETNAKKPARKKAA